MSDFISDEEMQALEGSEDFIPDDQVAALEAPVDKGFGPTADGSLRNPLEVDWMGAIKDSFTPKDDVIGGTPFDNPLFASAVPGGVGAAVGKGAVNVAQKAATSPLPGKIADATNVAGKVKSFIGNKLSGPAGAMKGILPEGVADFASGAAARAATYKTPLAPIQAISDSARLVQGGQKGVAWMLDNAPQKLGKFAAPLKAAADRGGTALATTSFLLSQSDPEFQEIMKSENDK